jgi:hypothetical protein
MRNEQALRDELSRLRRHCAALQTRVTDLESAPPATARKRRRAGHADDDEDDDENDDALFSAPSPPTPRLASWLAHVQTHLRSAQRGERLAVDVAALEADVAARGEALQEVVRKNTAEHDVGLARCAACGAGAHVADVLLRERVLTAAGCLPSLMHVRALAG